VLAGNRGVVALNAADRAPRRLGSSFVWAGASGWASLNPAGDTPARRGCSGAAAAPPPLEHQTPECHAAAAAAGRARPLSPRSSGIRSRPSAVPPSNKAQPQPCRRGLARQRPPRHTGHVEHRVDARAIATELHAERRRLSHRRGLSVTVSLVASDPEGSRPASSETTTTQPTTTPSHPENSEENCMASGVLVVGMAAGPFLRCLMMGRRSSRSMSFVLRRSSAMSVGRALHVELSSAPTGWQRSEDRPGVTAGAQRVSLARCVAALCARAFARTWSGTVHTCLIIFFASSRLIGWPLRSRSW
jgi:hypothetical protein